MPAFQPKRPTRVALRALGWAAFGSRTLTLLTVPRIDVGCALAFATMTESGIASMSPAPNSGVVRRPTLCTVASTRSTPSGTLQAWPPDPVNEPTVNSWRSDPPLLDRLSNTPLTNRPYLRSIWTPAPPTEPWVWQLPQAFSLKT